MGICDELEKEGWSREARIPNFEFLSRLGARWLKLRAQGRLLVVDEDGEIGGGCTATAPMYRDIQAGRGTAVQRISILSQSRSL